jgi:hypothetical protein
MSLRVLRMGVDTLEASFAGEIGEGVLRALHDAKLRAQETEEPQYAPLGGLDFRVSAQGAKPFKYKLVGDEAIIRATDSEKLPGASARLSALGLALYEPLSLYELIAEIVVDVLGPAGVQKISRVDVAIDFQGFDVAAEWLSGSVKFVCPASYRPIFPSTERPETFMFGRGVVVVRIYNKSRELAVSGKEWMRELWAGHPDYDPSQDVWRFEVQLRRKALLELGCDTPQEALSLLPELARYGLDWCDLRIPNGESTDRWERCDAWKLLTEATGTHTTLSREALKANLAELDRIVPAMAGYVISAGAVLDNPNPEAVLQVLATKIRKRLGDAEAYAASVAKRRVERLG